MKEEIDLTKECFESPSGESEMRERLQRQIASTLERSHRLKESKQRIDMSLTACRRELRRIENLSDPLQCMYFEPTALTSFYMNICYACDLALSAFGRRVLFSGEAGCAEVCRRVLMRQALNMISNAAVHSKSPCIFAELGQVGGRAVFTVRNAGVLTPCANNFKRSGSGLWYIGRAAELHSGAAVLCSCGGDVILSAGTKTAALEAVPLHDDFASLLCDRLSPVYTQLSTVE